MTDPMGPNLDHLPRSGFSPPLNPPRGRAVDVVPDLTKFLRPPVIRSGPPKLTRWQRFRRDFSIGLDWRTWGLPLVVIVNRVEISVGVGPVWFGWER